MLSSQHKGRETAAVAATGQNEQRALAGAAWVPGTGGAHCVSDLTRVLEQVDSGQGKWKDFDLGHTVSAGHTGHSAPHLSDCLILLSDGWPMASDLALKPAQRSPSPWGLLLNMLYSNFCNPSPSHSSQRWSSLLLLSHDLTFWCHC